MVFGRALLVDRVVVHTLEVPLFILQLSKLLPNGFSFELVFAHPLCFDVNLERVDVFYLHWLGLGTTVPGRLVLTLF